MARIQSNQLAVNWSRSNAETEVGNSQTHTVLTGDDVHRDSRDAKTEMRLDEHKVNFMPGRIIDQNCAVNSTQQHPRWAGVSVACNWRSPQCLCTVCVALLLSSNKKNCEVVVPKSPQTRCGGYSQQVALVETENVLKGVCSYRQGSLCLCICQQISSN